MRTSKSAFTIWPDLLPLPYFSWGAPLALHGWSFQRPSLVAIGRRFVSTTPLEKKARATVLPFSPKECPFLPGSARVCRPFFFLVPGCSGSASSPPLSVIRKTGRKGLSLRALSPPESSAMLARVPVSPLCPHTGTFSCVSRLANW